MGPHRFVCLLLRRALTRAGVRIPDQPGNPVISSRHDLEVPERLAALILAGVWPRDNEVARCQNSEPIVRRDRLQRLIPDEHHIYLYPPPFRTVKGEIDAGYESWDSPENALEQIDTALTVPIADFGHGSETLLALDYRKGGAPEVIRLKWSDDRPARNNRWVLVCKSFDDFCEALSLA